MGLISIFLRPMVTVFQAAAKMPAISRTILGFERCRAHNQNTLGRQSAIASTDYQRRRCGCGNDGDDVGAGRVLLQLSSEASLEEVEAVVDSRLFDIHGPRQMATTGGDGLLLCAAGEEKQLGGFDGRRQFPCSRQGSSRDTPVPAANARAGQRAMRLDLVMLIIDRRVQKTRDQRCAGGQPKEWAVGKEKGPGAAKAGAPAAAWGKESRKATSQAWQSPTAVMAGQGNRNMACDWTAAASTRVFQKREACHKKRSHPCRPSR
jgi:hypothetical protein